MQLCPALCFGHTWAKGGVLSLASLYLLGVGDGTAGGAPGLGLWFLGTGSWQSGRLRAEGGRGGAEGSLPPGAARGSPWPAGSPPQSAGFPSGMFSVVWDLQSSFPHL